MRRRLLLLFLALVILGPLVLLALVLEGQPRVAEMATTDTLDAGRTRSALNRLKPVLDPDVGADRYAISEVEMNSAFAVAARGLPALRGRAEFAPEAITLSLSAQVPNPLTALWLNLSVVVTPSDQGLLVERITLGHIDLPPSFGLAILRTAVKTVFEDDLVGIALKSVKQVVTRGRIVFVVVDMTRDERATLLASGKRVFEKLSPSGRPRAVRRYYQALDQAVRSGALPRFGSFTAYLRYAFDLAEQQSANGDPREEVASAIFALAIYCGHWRVQYLVGEVITGEYKKRRSLCDNATLAGRRDLRQHFIVSAALEVANENGIAFPMGEIKELLDGSTRSGFDFMDLAADRAGIRFATTMLDSASRAAERQALASQFNSEAALFPNLAGLPQAMSDSEFRRQFKNVDSALYKEVLSEIDRRIDGLPLYRAQ